MNLGLALLWLVELVGGLFLLLPYLTRDLYNKVLWRGLSSFTLGRLVGLVVSVASIILLYATITA